MSSSPGTWLADDLPPDPLTSDLEIRQLRQEMRETTTTMAGLRQEFAATQTQYSGELSRLSSRLSPLETGASRASSQLQALQNNLQELNQRLSQALKQLNDQAVPSSRGLRKIETELINIQQKLAAATLELGTQDDALNRRIGPIETEIRRLSGLIVAAQGNTARITSPLEAQLSAKLTAIEMQLHTFASKPELQTLSVDTHSLTEAFQRLDTELHRLTYRLNNLAIPEPVDIAPLETRMHQLSEDSLQIQQTLEALQHELHTLQTTGLSSQKILDIKVLQGRVDNLQCQLEPLTLDLHHCLERVNQLTQEIARPSAVIPDVDLAPLEIAISRLQQHLVDLTAQFDQQLQTVGLTIQNLSTTQQDQRERLAQLAPLASELSSVRSSVEQLSETVTASASAVNLESLEAAFAQLQQHLAELVNQADRDREAVTAHLQTLNTSQLSYGERLSQLEPLAFELSSLRDQIQQVQQTSAEPVNLEPLETTLAQLQHQLGELVNQADHDRETVQD
ncbi:MAG: hypothetical protein HC926_04550 [Synechococcaceae cyanobacterium SM2_3_60]|nr:hypothetical protein [Synechococcaceae cyanobacterium SM2_3_60]